MDGHIILDRDIAERGRYPAINLRRSVSRSLPGAATLEENELLLKVRRLITKYEEAQTLIQAGLYVAGSDAVLDEAIVYYPAIEQFMTQIETLDTQGWFARLAAIFESSSIDVESKENQTPETQGKKQEPINHASPTLNK